MSCSTVTFPNTKRLPALKVRITMKFPELAYRDAEELSRTNAAFGNPLLLRVSSTRRTSASSRSATKGSPLAILGELCTSCKMASGAAGIPLYTRESITERYPSWILKVISTVEPSSAKARPVSICTLINPYCWYNVRSFLRSAPRVNGFRNSSFRPSFSLIVL